MTEARERGASFNGLFSQGALLESKATLSSSSSQGPQIRDRPSRLALVAVQHGDVPAGGAVLRMVTEIDYKPPDPD